MNICRSNEYIQCTNTSCRSLPLNNMKNKCDASTNGKLIKTGRFYSLCTKINQLDMTTSKVNSESYVSIPFKDSESENDRYLIHHAGEGFNFDRTTTTTYYVVHRNATAIVFDPTFENVKDHCADTSGLMMDRVSDFCSHNSSGMYYTCTTGKCMAEYQTNENHFENNGEKCKKIFYNNNKYFFLKKIKYYNRIIYKIIKYNMLKSNFIYLFIYKACNCIGGKALETCKLNIIIYFF